jgi:hypothetical protein
MDGDKQEQQRMINHLDFVVLWASVILTLAAALHLGWRVALILDRRV